LKLFNGVRDARRARENHRVPEVELVTFSFRYLFSSSHRGVGGLVVPCLDARIEVDIRRTVKCRASSVKSPARMAMQVHLLTAWQRDIGIVGRAVFDDGALLAAFKPAQ
jgi:hypothetical protein